MKYNFKSGDVIGDNGIIFLNKVESNDKNSKGLFLCHCGNTFIARISNVKSGVKKSCGCLNPAKKIEYNLNDIVGPYKAAFIKEVEKKNSHARRALFRCGFCGQIFESQIGAVKNGSVMSCGCIRVSKGEIKIEQLLLSNNISFEKEKSFEGLVGGRNVPLRFDFYVENSYLIEFDGIQHFYYTNEGWNTKEAYEKLASNDIKKNNWCKENNIPLIRIPYSHLNKLLIEDLLLETSSFII